MVRHSGKVMQVCLQGFIAIHDITNKKLKLLLAKQKASLTSTLTPDMRRKHPNSLAISGTILDHIHEHIKLIPVTSRHDTGAKKSSLTVC